MASSRMIWAKLTVILMGSLFTAYATSTMTTYLNTVWEMSLTRSAAVVNVYGGIVAILPLLVHFIKDTSMGDYWMIVLLGCAHTTGFVFLTMSTPPFLHRATGTCSAYEARCIGGVQGILFYMSLNLIAFGASGRFMVEKYRKEQLIKPLLEGAKIMQFFFWSVCPKNIKPLLKGTKPMKVFWSVRPKKIKLLSFRFLVSTLVAVTIAYLKPWLLKFALPAICTFAVALTLFTSSRPQKAEGSLLTREEIRSIGRMSGIGVFFILISFVSSLGNTYFTTQASKMNHKVGHIKVSILFLIEPRNWVRAYLRDSKKTAKMIPPKIGILLSMILAILCCITAALVETRRVGVAKSNGLLDKPDETVPMTMFWLLPQYLLVGGVSGFSSMGIVRFFSEEILHWQKEKDDVADVEVDEGLVDPKKENEKYKRQYLDFFADALVGVGKLISPFWIYAVNKIKPTWFQDSLNRSHLYSYYWTLAAFSAANLLCFILVIFYWLGSEKKEVSAADEAADEEEEDDATNEGEDKAADEGGDDDVTDEEGEDVAADEDGDDDVTVEEREDAAANEEGENDEPSEGPVEVDKACEEVADAADEEGKVDAEQLDVEANIDMAEMKEQLDEAKNQLGDEAKFDRDELHGKEHRDMALNLSHIIDIADELKEEVDNQSCEEANMETDVLESIL